MTNSARVMEIEWQFIPDDLESVREWLEQEAPEPFSIESLAQRELRDEYWDTTGWLVWRAGFACRTRRRGESAELTLKGLAGGEGHLRKRLELDEPMDGLGELAGAVAHPAGEASMLLRRLVGPHPLRSVAALTTHRTTLGLSDAKGPLGEIALDRTTVGEGSKSLDLLRVEVEVGEDAVARAEPFVAALRDGAGLRPAQSGKLAAALAAAGASPGWEPSPVGPMSIDRDSSLAEVAYAALRRGFLRLVEHEPLARLGEDIEGVHQMRVATRRLRAALKTFRDILPPALAEERRELRWLGRSLGEARDLDVQRERFALAAPLIGRKAAAAIGVIFEERRASTQEVVLAALDSERYVAMVETMSDLLRAGPTPGLGYEPALASALETIEEQRRRARRLGSAIDSKSPDADYHALRLKVRDLRYVLEFFAPLGGEAADAYVRQATRLQPLLGDHQDAVVAADFHAGLARDEGEHLGKAGVRAARELAANATAEAEGYRWKFPKRYGRLRGARWHALRRALSNS
ncbi:MAG: CHAD domain-containing protein [Dehalococcoidia bacterium]|nr:CHAD domain-containing protein [Dehalococcoidia bacterium]